MRVSDLMSLDVAACGPNESLDGVARRMWEKDCGCIPIVDDVGRVMGVITDRDVCMAAYTRGLPLTQIRAWSAAAHHAFVVREDDALSDAEEIMGRKQVRRVPVVDDDGQLKGMLSLADIAAHVHGLRDGGGDALSAARLADTLAAISQPRPGSGHS